MVSCLKLSRPRRLAVLVGCDLIGDALIKLPFLRALRHAFPEVEIAWITTEGTTAFAGLLRDATTHLIHTIDETPEWLNETSLKRAPYFDLVLDTRNRWKQARKARRIIPHGCFVAMAMRYLFSDLRPSFFQKPPVHIVDRLLQMVELVAVEKPQAAGNLPVAEDLRRKARRILPEGPVYVGLAPGAGNPVKIWPCAKFEQLARTQTEQGCIPVFLLGPQEQDLVERLRASVPGARFPLQEFEQWETSKLTVAHTLAVAECLNVAVANDSGVGNMLGAMNCRLVSLFGPTSPDKLAPRVSCGRVIRAQDFGGAHMDAIPVDAVNSAVSGLV